MSTLAFDLGHPGVVARELGEASGRLARASEVGPSIKGLVRGLADALGDLDPHALGHDPYLLLELEKAQVRALRALDEDDPVAERRATRLALENLRALFSRLAEQTPTSDERPVKEVARWLVKRLDVPQREIAEALRVNPRTFGRWASEHEPQAPSGQEARKLRVLAALAAHLRFALTGPGVISWLCRPNPALDGLSPRDLLDDPDAIDKLTRAARAARVSAAT